MYNEMLIVTAYYKIPNKVKATHGVADAHSFYMEHMKRLFKYIKTPILFFTDVECHKELRVYARDNVEFVIYPFEEIRSIKQYSIPFWEMETKHDGMPYNTWQLGAIWANKKYFVEEASERRPNNEWYVWMDAGCIRSDEWEDYLEDFTNRDYILKEGVYMQALRPTPSDFLYCIRLNGNAQTHSFIAGAIIVFHKTYIKKYIESYTEMVKEYIYENISVYDDQHIMSSIAQRYSWIYPIQTIAKALPDIWFLFLAII